MDSAKVRVFSSVGGADAPAFWTAWLDGLEGVGFDIEEISAVSSQDYRAAEGAVSRAMLRFRMYAVMFVRLVKGYLTSPRGSVLIATTNPFYAPWLVATLTDKRRRVVNLQYDLYPDSLIAAGTTTSSGPLARWLSRLTSAGIRKSDATVYLGRRIEQHAARQYGKAPLSRVIPVGADCRHFTSPPRRHLASPIELLYCGNLGVLHETQVILASLPGVDARYRGALRFRFHASGPCLPSFVDAVRNAGLGDGFTFGGPLGNDEWHETMRRCPIGLVLLKDAAGFAAVPSKVYSAMAAGQAVLAVCPRASDLADIVLDYECGWVVEPADRAGLTEVLEQIVRDPESVDEKRRNAYRAAQDHFCMAAIAQQWKALIEAL